MAKRLVFNLALQMSMRAAAAMYKKIGWFVHNTRQLTVTAQGPEVDETFYERI